MHNPARFFVIILTALLVQSRALPQEVQLTETEIQIPTYLVGEPEKNPVFYVPNNYQGAQMHVYPYPMIDKLTDVKAQKSYKALFLENEYIRICVLPELGGRLYTAEDKSNGYDFIYRNRVIKPALIGMAGAWISGGVEWNIPHHHRVSTFMPVDYTFTEEEDGGKTVWVGEYEKRHQTRWITGLTLRPGRAYVEVTMKHLNATAVHQSLLMWANLAVHANENYQVVFPPDVERAVFHSKVQFTDWPVSHQRYMGIDFTAGMDVSWWKNTSSPTSFFAWDTDMDFMGGIDHGKKAGTVLTSNHRIFPGKKFWNWGNNAVARLWDQMLTDEDGTYLELMMGLFSDNQPDYSWNDPMDVRSGTMLVYPVKNLDHIKNANRDIALNMEAGNQAVRVQAYATLIQENAKLALFRNGVEIYGDALNIDPSTTYEKEIPLPAGTDPLSLRVEITDWEGRSLISYQPRPRKNDPEPETYKDPPQPEEIATAQELVLRGQRLEQFGNPDFDPAAYFQEALKREPDHVQANMGMGRLRLRQGSYQEAEGHFRKAAAKAAAWYTSPKDGEPLYYLGLVLSLEGRDDEAEELLHKAAWNHEWESPAYTLLAMLDCRKGNPEGALEKLKSALEANTRNEEALFLKAVLLRKTQRQAKAFETIAALTELDPLHPGALYEYCRLSEMENPESSAESWGLFISRLRDEPDSYLEIAGRYGQAGFYEDALDVLNRAAGSGIPKLHGSPMIHYHKGYYLDLKGDTLDAGKSFLTASGLAPDYCFPYGRISEQALLAALRYSPNNVRAHYYLGNLYCDSRPEKALEEWKRTAAGPSPPAVCFRNMAFVQAHVLDDIQSARLNIKKAIHLDPQDPLYFNESDAYDAYAGISPSLRHETLRKNMKTVGQSDEAILRAISLMIFAGEYDRAIGILETRHFRVPEITDLNPHKQWTDAFILRGVQALEKGKQEAALQDFSKVLEFPRNLEVAADAKAGISHFWMGKAQQASGDAEGAKAGFNAMIATPAHANWGGSSALVHFYRGLAYRELGNDAEAKEVFSRLAEEGSSYEDEKHHSALDQRSVSRRQDLKNRKAEALFTHGLGYLGLGRKDEARALFQKALDVVPGFLDAHVFLTNEAMLKLIQPS